MGKESEDIKISKNLVEPIRKLMIPLIPVRERWGPKKPTKKFKTIEYGIN